MSINCVLPQNNFERINLGHGGGGRLSHDLIKKVISLELGSTLVSCELDSGIVQLNDLNLENRQLLFTTDSFVVDPLFFPGGDIGKLSIVGTINDLAVMGAAPLGVSLSFILEEGLLITDFRKILQSIRAELDNLGTKIICGDTKVVPRGKCDRIFINTSGIGYSMVLHPWEPKRIQIGDSIILSRDIGNHGAAVICTRQNLKLETPILSDCHELLSLTKSLINAQLDIRCCRDLTRGGLLSALVEVAETSHMQFEIDEKFIPKNESVGGLCELLGFDPLILANEGACILFVSSDHSEKAINILNQFDFCQNACVIGKVTQQREGGQCLLKLPSGVSRRLTLPSGELLPRIC